MINSDIASKNDGKKNLTELVNFIGDKMFGDDWNLKKYQLLDKKTLQDQKKFMSEKVDDFIKKLACNSFFDLYEKHHGKLLDIVQLESLSSGVGSDDPSLDFDINNFDSLKTLFEGTPEKNSKTKTYFTPDNFLIAEEQFNYFIKTGKKWIDRQPNPRYQGMVVSECYTNNFCTIIDNYSMMLVEDRSNLISYFELKKFLEKKFVDITEYDIEFWLKSQHYSITALEKNISSDGYVKFLPNVAANSKKNYKAAFYHKKQIENFIPKHFFIDYQSLLEKWQKECGISECEVESLRLKYLSVKEVMSLFNIKRTKDFITHPPQNKDYQKRFKNYSDDIHKYNEQEKINFIKECFFEKSYIKKIEEEHLVSMQKDSTEEKTAIFDNNLENTAPIIFKVQNESTLERNFSGFAALHKNFSKLRENFQIKGMPDINSGFMGNDLLGFNNAMDLLKSKIPRTSLMQDSEQENLNPFLSIMNPDDKSQVVDSNDSKMALNNKNVELKTTLKSKNKRGPLAFGKMAKAIKNNYPNKKKMWEFLFSMAEQENKDFKNEHSFVNFKIVQNIQIETIRWSTIDSKDYDIGETISQKTFFRNHPKY